MDNLGYIDFILLGLIAFSAFRGFFAGFIRELFGLLGLILGMVFASRYAYEMGEWVKLKVYPFESPTLSTLVGFVLILLLIWLGFIVACRLASYLTKGVFPYYLNALLGSLFGVLKMFIGLGILLHLVFRIEAISSGLLNHFGTHSIIHPSMENIASKIIASEIIKRIPTNQEELKEGLEEAKEKALDTMKDGLNERIQEAQ